MTNRELRRALLEKLGVTPQALSYQVQKLKKQYPMTTEDATYVIAHREGITLDKYLDRAAVDRVRDLVQLATPSVPSRSIKARKTFRGKQEHIKDQRIVILGEELNLNIPVLSQKTISEAKQMAVIYPLVYILENSVRAVIDRIMMAKHGKDWWDSEAPRKLKDTVIDRMADEKRNAWHQRRGSRPIDYLDLDQLPALMRKIQTDVVPGIIPSFEWFEQLVVEVYKSRCVICHMNPLDRDNTEAVKVRFRQWQKQMDAKKSLIPTE